MYSMFDWRYIQFPSQKPYRTRSRREEFCFLLHFVEWSGCVWCVDVRTAFGSNKYSPKTKTTGWLIVAQLDLRRKPFSTRSDVTSNEADDVGIEPDRVLASGDTDSRSSIGDRYSVVAKMIAS